MSAYFDAYSENYKEIIAKSTGENLQSASFFAEQKAAHLARCCKESAWGQTILDYGCGVGMSLRPLHQKFPGAKLAGADPSQLSLDVAAREHTNMDVDLIPLDHLHQPKYEHYFDLIFISCVFHHIKADQHISTLKTLRKLCSARGKLAIFEHNPANPITRKIVSECPFDEGVTLISPKQLGERLKIAGWGQLQTRYISFIPPKFKQFKSLEPLLSWLPLGGQYFITAEPI
jgi:ubiquinone/menaquinone biosynthesis C-methylase UbiE